MNGNRKINKKILQHDYMDLDQKFIYVQCNLSSHILMCNVSRVVWKRV